MSVENHDHNTDSMYDDEYYYEYLEYLDEMDHPTLCGSNHQNSSIVEHMLTESYIDGNTSESLTTQMERFSLQNPEAFVFTARSAIPVADSVRGWYEERGQIAPTLAYIRADRSVSSEEADRVFVGKRVLEESARLRRELGGARAIVIDQYVHSGRTLKFAEKVLRVAGVTVCDASYTARWYDQFYGKLDLSRMTSEYSEFMKDIGRQAACGIDYWSD